MIPKHDARQELFHLAMFGHLHFQSLWAGIELGIFELLHARGPLGLDEIAAATGLAIQPAKMVMANLVALDTVERTGERFDLNEVSRRFLLQSSPDSVVAVMRWQALIVYPGVQDYVRALRDNRNTGLERFPGPGRTLYERLAANPQLEQVFQEAMAGMPSNRFLPEVLPLQGHEHLCDCGGGAGRNAVALCRKHPALRVTIFDQPTVCRKAQERVAAEGLADRIDTHAGNFLQDPFPPGMDAVLYSHIGSIFSPQTNVSVFRRACAALPPGGRLFIFNMVPRDDHSGPLSVTCGSVYFHALATGEGFMHSVPEYEAMLREAGFGRTECIRPLPVEHALVIGIK
ncbi:MAG: methyltransferase [Myxococcales bacterium]|nr:methyltransferase [Myxococcota bacterium]MDW8282459.1 methyltransferase [Myxococcales bacterium]